VESGRVAFWYLPIADSCPLGRGSGATLPRVENAVIGNGGHVPARVATRRPGTDVDLSSAILTSW
jgi:hypothetical protein